MLNNIQNINNPQISFNYNNTNTTIKTDSKVITFKKDEFQPNSENSKKGFLTKVSDFFKTPTGKAIAIGGGIALAGALIFTPIIPITISGIGVGVSALGSAIGSLGSLISSSAAPVAAGLSAVGSTLTSIITSPFGAGFLGGVAGTLLAGYLSKPNNNCCNPVQSTPVQSTPVQPTPVQPTPTIPVIPIQPTTPPQTISIIDGPDIPEEVISIPQYCQCNGQLPDEVFNFQNASKKLDSLGIEERFVKKLNAIGINTVGDLLKQGRTPAGREKISQQSGIHPVDIIDWVQKADMKRFSLISGLDEKYVTLLQEAGIYTISELRYHQQYALFRQLQQANSKTNIVDRLPSTRILESWIQRAKNLPVIITY